MNNDSYLVASHETSNTNHQTLKIRALNDALRRSGNGGKVLITHGIAAQEPTFAKAVLEAVQKFDNFSDGSDIWAEHDFASLVVMHQRVLWKIYYDRAGLHHSADPSSRTVTLRVLTIMLAEEY